VDYTGFSSIDVKDFGKKFLDKVANPQGLLLFKKPAARAAAADPDTGKPNEAEVHAASLHHEDILASAANKASSTQQRCFQTTTLA